MLSRFLCCETKHMQWRQVKKQVTLWTKQQNGISTVLLKLMINAKLHDFDVDLFYIQHLNVCPITCNHSCVESLQNLKKAYLITIIISLLCIHFSPRSQYQCIHQLLTMCQFTSMYFFFYPLYKSEQSLQVRCSTKVLKTNLAIWKK